MSYGGSRLGRFSTLLILAALSACREEPRPIKIEKVVTVAERAPITVNGSSTVHPISKGILDLYASRLVADVKLDFSGTGGGFKLFCKRNLTINAASRPITPAEAKLCVESGVEYVEVPIAFDGVAVVVPAKATFVDALTINELKKIWEPASEGTVRTWKHVRSSFPDEKLELFAPGLDSGTFDFFTSVVCGDAGKSRSDYQGSEDDEEIVRMVTKSQAGIGYFGLAHLSHHANEIRPVPIDDENPSNGQGPILPTADAVSQGTYQPLSRPLFLYVSSAELERPEVLDFVEFYLKSARLVVPDVGAVPLTPKLLKTAHERLVKRVKGSAFAGISDVVGLSLEDLYEAEVVAVSDPRHQ